MKRLRLVLLVPLLFGLYACFDSTGPGEGRKKEDPDDNSGKTGVIAAVTQDIHAVEVTGS